MGLSQRKEKQRIGYDPRNLSWSGDKDRFSYKHMRALGWTDSSGIGGSDLTGNAKHIAVVHKLDSSGIGMARAMKEGDEMGGQARAGLEDVLKRLASASASASASTSLEGSPAPDVKPGGERQSIRNRIASRQRHLQSKRLASSSPAALAEILGIAPSALPSPDTVTVKIEPGTLPLPDIKPVINPSTPVREAEDMVSTSTLSVSDYFRQKMRAKALARHAADGTAPPPEPILPSASSSKPVTEWEGTKVAFTETEAVPLSFTENADDLAEPTRAEGETKEAKKAAKKVRKAEKEAKRALKAEKKAKKEAQVGKESNEGNQGKKKKRKRDTE